MYGKIKFVIYGAGYRGKRLLDYLGKDKVIAYIDSNPKLIGGVCGDLPIISIDEYQKIYNGIDVIVAPIDFKDIVKELEKRKITCYSNLSELPSEFSGYGKQNFDSCYKEIVKKYECPCYVYGKNAFGLLLYEAIKNAGNDVSMIGDEENIKQGIVFVAKDESEEKLYNRFKEAEIIDAYDYSSNHNAYFNGKIAKLKNSYKDKKRCFVVATGPSLRKNDLEKLHYMKEFSISMNRIYNIECMWHPNIYVVVDSVLMNEDRDKISKYNVPLKIYSDANNPPDEKGMIVHIVSTNPNNHPRFSDNFAQKAYGGCTVTYVCLQLAIYLGFEEIYMLGVDCNYVQASKKNYFYELKNEDKLKHNVDGMLFAYEAAKKYAELHGVRIYNATRGGNLEVFDRVDFDELF